MGNMAETEGSGTGGTYRLRPIGEVEKKGEAAVLNLRSEFRDGMLGAEAFSHVWVFFWFHGNDDSASRSVLRVHPRKNRDNPLTGVFFTRSPMRPNLIGQCLCEVLEVNPEAGRIRVAGLDARDGTPLLDIKPYLPHSDVAENLHLPAWAGTRRKCDP
jgi:tRNA-Thr(GGU) m(6)t(6)A37 methyltransferase TsaA